MGTAAGEAMALGRRFVAALADIPLAELPDEALLAMLRETEVLRRKLDAQRSRMIDRVHRRGAGRLDGAASTAAWLRSRLNLADPKRQVDIAVAARQVPEVGEAYARGEISADHVAVVAKVLPDLDPQVLEAGAGKLLAEHAADLTPQRFARVAVRVRDHFDVGSADLRATRQFQRRYLRAARTFEGMVAIEGMLDPEGGEAFLSALAAVTPPPRRGDERTAPQRRADALIELCRLASSGGPTTGGPRPDVTVVVDLETLRGAAAEPGGATLADGTPIAAETARRMACDARVIPAVLGGAGEVLDLGRTARVVSTAQRRALDLRDRGCRFPGCDRPPRWADGHHIRHWGDGGPTDLSNLILLCRWHHSLVHEGRWSIHFDAPTNTVTATRPDGRPLDLISPPPARPP